MPLDLENTSESEIEEEIDEQEQEQEQPIIDQNEKYRQTLKRVDELLSEKRNYKKVATFNPRGRPRKQPQLEQPEDESDNEDNIINYINNQIEILQQKYEANKQEAYKEQAIEMLDKLLELGSITTKDKRDILTQFFK